ncbi:MAG: hypothetical protein NT116_02115 [Candidatus Parcubacteria bacterium]|nr:hypothetical protein [Candidatus Parcubacteria bacterium]
MLQKANAKNAENAKKYFCENCDFKCCKLCDWNRHLATLKHINATKCYQNAIDFTPKNASSKINCPICDKQFSHTSSMFRHKKKCVETSQKKSEMNNVSSLITPELIIELVKNNTGLQQTIHTLVSNGITNTHSNNIHTNSHNNSFNLQFFLNETCKNAMNIMDFANSIQVQLTDLEKVGELGYVEGISKIIIDNLKLLDVTERPVHCSDFKRDVVYVKDADKWQKENEDKPKIKKLINSVTDKNISLISEWKHTNSECTNINSNKSTKVNKMIMEIMDTDKEKREKIMKKIAKEIVIEKETVSDA